MELHLCILGVGVPRALGPGDRDLVTETLSVGRIAPRTG